MQKYKKNMNMLTFFKKIRHFLSRNPARKASGLRSSGHCRKATQKVGNGFSGAELPFRSPPDDRRSPEDLRQDALAMAKEWQAELQKWMETLKRHAT